MARSSRSTSVAAVFLRMGLLGLLVSASIAACGGDGGGVTGPAAVETVRIAPSPDTLRALDATRQLTATALDAQGDPVSVDGFEWTSTDPAVVTVNESGTVTATGNGSAVVRASVGSATGDAEMFVSQEVSGVTITPATAGLTELATTQQFQAEATDRNDNAVTDVDFVWISSDPSVAVVDTTGLATAEGSGQTTITAAARGVPANAVLSVTPDAAQLAFTVQPSDAEAGADIDPGVQVEIRDSGGNLLEDARNQVTLALAGGPAEAELLGTATVGATGGVANFPGLNVEVAGAGYTLVASTAGLPNATSGNFSVTSGPAAKLGFLSRPAVEESAGDPLGIQVAVQDEYGNTVPVTSPSVGIDLPTGPSAGELMGTTQSEPVDGVVDFSGTSIQLAGLDYSLRARAEALTTVRTDTFDIVPAAPDSVRFVSSLVAGPVGGTTSGVEAEVIDRYENVVDTFSADVSLALASAPWPGSILDGVSTQPAVEGIATFDGLVPNKVGQPYQIALSTPTAGVEGNDQFFVYLPTAYSVAAGRSHTCVGTGVRPVCWGGNGAGQLGTTSVGSAGDSVATAVDGSAVIPEVSAGADHTCGIDTGGAAYCWGSNANGKLGDGSTATSQLQPVPVQGGITFAQISAGTDHTCGVSTGGDAYCWGSNAQGQLGTGSTGGTNNTPVPVTAGSSFVHVSAGGAHTCALATDDNVYCWGDNASGQLGDGNLGIDSPSPVMVVGGGTYTHVEVGDAHSCGVVTSGPGVPNVNCWGDNASGQLGDANLGTNSDTPRTVVGSAFTVEVNTFEVIERGAIDVGSEHACAIIQEDAGFELACWGANTTGQLGIGTTSAGSDLAVGIPDSNDYTWENLGAGAGHTCADAVGSVSGTRSGLYCWGGNGSGQLGDGSTVLSADPVRIVQ